MGVFKFNNFDTLRLQVIKLALLQYNKEYVWAKRGPDTFDCSGFTWYLYYELFNLDINNNGYGLSTTTKQMTSDIGILTRFDENDENKINYINDIKSGDILFFHRQSMKENEPIDTNKYPGHCGIYLYDGLFIHASRPNGKIIINSLKESYWLSVLVGYKNIIDDLNKDNTLRL